MSTFNITARCEILPFFVCLNSLGSHKSILFCVVAELQTQDRAQREPFVMVE